MKEQHTETKTEKGEYFLKDDVGFVSNGAGL
jgi:hypothetical protein